VGGASRLSIMIIEKTTTIKHIHTTKNIDALTSMFDLCRQVIPYLNGNFENPQQQQPLKNNSEWLTGQAQDYQTIQALKADLKKQNPDAGSAYYQARLWHLLCWQPIYITFISVYGLKQLPDFTGFKQQRQHNAIIGFVFQSNNVSTGEIEPLITQAGKQLKPLIEHYRIQLNSLQRCPSGYAGRFIADSIMSNLLRVREFAADFDDQILLDHAKQWLNAFSLPEKLINSLQSNTKKPIKLVRTSCCLADRINEKLCADCPKANK